MPLTLVLIQWSLTRVEGARRSSVLQDAISNVWRHFWSSLVGDSVGVVAEVRDAVKHHTIQDGPQQRTVRKRLTMVSRLHSCPRSLDHFDHIIVLLFAVSWFVK